MSDEADRANEEVYRHLDRAIAAVRRDASFKAEMCLNECGEPPRPDSNYCSTECLNDHEQWLKAVKLRGRNHG